MILSNEVSFESKGFGDFIIVKGTIELLLKSAYKSTFDVISIRAGESKATFTSND